MLAAMISFQIRLSKLFAQSQGRIKNIELITKVNYRGNTYFFSSFKNKNETNLKKIERY